MVAELITVAPLTSDREIGIADTEPTPFVPLRYAFPWSEDLFRFGETEDGSLPMIDRVGLQSFNIDDSLPERTTIHLGVALLDELLLEIPGLSGVGVVFGAPKRNADGTTGGIGAEFGLALGLGDPFSFGIDGVDIVLRMQQNLIRSVIRDENGKWVPAPHPFEMRLDGVGVSADTSGSVNLTFAGGAPGVEIDPFAIGDTGIVVEPDQPVRIFFSQAGPVPPGRPAGWRGVYIPHALVHLPHFDFPAAPAGLEFSDCSIGTGGFSGELDAVWDPKTTTGNFLGMTFGLSRIGLRIVQNVPVRSTIAGELTLPFFDHKIAVEITIGFDGTLQASLSAVQPPGVTYNSGIVTLEKPGLLRLKLSSIGFELKNGIFTTKLSGEVTPLAGADQGVEWTTFPINGLSIDSNGHVHLDGGWLDLPNHRIVKFHGFQLEISKLGFGNTEDGGKWIGFTGGVKLVEGMPAGASVDGLKITWHPNGAIDTSLNGVSVNFEIPNTLKFAGEVSFHPDVDPDKQYFSGSVKLNLMALKMEVDATAVFKMKDGQPCLALYLAAEFPAGIPLFATGLGVYGMAGLFAMNMAPNKLPEEPWYAMQPAADWYHKGDVGVTSLSKWTTSPGTKAFGAGVTLGTVADNGHTFSGKMLLVIAFPGPVLMIQGSASILHERTPLEGNDANFRALAVLDGRAGTFTLGLDAQYHYDDSGSLIDIHGAAEGYFNFNDPSAWHLNVGLKDPRERRLTARLFKLFDSYSYVALNSQQLAMGAWIGFKQNWQFGPLSVGLEAWIDANATVSWKPAHFYGDLALHGSAKLAVFGFGVSLTVDAKIAADVFDPLHVLGQFSVAIDLPWPFKDIAVNVALEWGSQPTRPPLPLPLKQVAIEHFKASSSWQLPRPTLNTPGFLLPNHDKNGDGFYEDTNDSSVPADLSLVPIVPLDSRPHITFARNINDDALIGVNAMRVVPEFERIGDPLKNQGPARIRYGLQEIALEKLKAGSWTTVARKGMTANDPGVSTLFGSWAPMPQMPAGGGQNLGQTKLWLWSKTPFEYSRRSSRAWDEWFNDAYDGYPCQTLSGTEWNFEQIDPGPLPMDWTHPDPPPLMFDSGENSVAILSRPSHGLTHAFGMTGRGRANLMLERPTNLIRIMITDSRLIRVQDFVGRDSGLGVWGAKLGGTPDRPYIEIQGVNMNRFDYFPEVHLPIALTENVGNAVGGAYLPSLNRVVFVESVSGNLSYVDPDSSEYVILGRGYQRPQDVVVTAEGAVAYVAEETGTLLRVDLTRNADQVNASVITKGLSAPHQIALDEEGGKAYVVEFVAAGAKGPLLSGAGGRLLSIDLDGPTAGTQTVLATGFDQAVGVLTTADVSTAYVGEQGNGGRLLQVDLNTGRIVVVAENLDGIFFLRWADAEQTAILAVLRGGFNQLLRIDLKDPGNPLSIMEGSGFHASNVILLPDSRYVLCNDDDVEMFTTTLWIPKVCDVGGDLLVRHFQDELARWTQAGEVLEPHTMYRLKVKTQISARGEGQLAGYSVDKPVEEYAYFQTDGPPGVTNLTKPISASASASAPAPYEGPLDDLSRYVSKTMPAAASENSRPFYRAYDVGIQFDENYVDLMYRLGRRDLSVHLYDTNGAIRDAEGRRLVLANQWGRAEDVTLNEREERWLSVLRSGSCGLINIDKIVRNSTFNAPHTPHVMSPSAMCEARLIPALLHDDFGKYDVKVPGPSGSIDRWQVRDDAGSKSHWFIGDDGQNPPDFEMIQNELGTTSLVYQNAPGVPVSEQPSNWTDYRLTVSFRHKDGKVGVVFRYGDNANHYRFVLDAATKTSQLIAISKGLPIPIANGPYNFVANEDRVVHVEVAGSSLRLYVEEGDPKLETVLEVTDARLSAGSIGLFTSGTSDARFTDVYVDDYRKSAPVVYRYSFTTSRFRNFVDHLNSFEKKTWRATLSAAANVAPLISQAASPNTAVSDAETRAYGALLAQLPDVTLTPDVVQVTRVEQNSSAIAFLLQSPEALDWSRINVQLLRRTPGDTIYSPVTAKVLRKIDGAGAFIVAPVLGSPGSSLPQAEYRLVLTFRRDNRSFDPRSDVLSEAGNTGTEEVSLDIPWQTQ